MRRGHSAIISSVARAGSLTPPPDPDNILPEDRRYPWQPGVTIGVPGGSEAQSAIDIYKASRTNIVTVTGLDPTGVDDAAAIINSTMNAAPADSVIDIPEGIFRLDTPIKLAGNKANLTIRGRGADTILRMYSNDAIHVGDNGFASPITPTSSPAKGATSITVSSEDEGSFSVGTLMKIRTDRPTDDQIVNEDAVPIIELNNYRFVRQQYVRVTAKSGNTLTFWPPFAYDTTSLPIEIVIAYNPCRFIGVEDLVIEGTGPGVGGDKSQRGVTVEQSYGCWIDNVEVREAENYGFCFWDSLQCEIRHSFANKRRVAGTNGGGLLADFSSGIYAYNNVFYRFFPVIEINHGASACVFAYNLMEDSRSSNGDPAQGGAMNSNHGAHTCFNLYEGNIVTNLQADGYFGSCSEDVIFRCWLHGTTRKREAEGFVVSLNRCTRNYTLGANIIGTKHHMPEFSMGNPNMGNSDFDLPAVHPWQGTFWEEWEAWKAASPGAGVPGGGGGGFQNLDGDVRASTTMKSNKAVYSEAYMTGSDSTGNYTGTIPASVYLTDRPYWWPEEMAWPNLTVESIPSVVLDLENDDWLDAAWIELIPCGQKAIDGMDA